jgi:hypothetical protein
LATTKLNDGWPAVLQSSATLRPVTGAESTGDRTKVDITASRVPGTDGKHLLRRPD